MYREFYAVLKSRPGASLDERDALLRDLAVKHGVTFPERPAITDLDRAQDILFDAWEMTGRRRYDLARKALEVSADCADALTILAEQAKTLEEGINLYEKAVAAATRGMGDRPFEEDVGDFWLVAETRPYMRARAELARSLVEAGRLEEAREHFRDMLRLNAHDSQGMLAAPGEGTTGGGIGSQSTATTAIAVAG